MSKIIKIENNNIDKETLIFLSNELKNGKIFILPTSTIYGICCNALNVESVEKVYEIKKRNKNNPFIVLINSIEMLQNVVDGISCNEEKIIAKYWPGSLTLVTKKSNMISNVVSAGKDTIGVRWDENKVINDILSLANVPIIAPSANISGKENVDAVEDIDEEIKERVDYIIDVGVLNNKTASTIIKVEEEKINVLREGKIKKHELLKQIK